MEQQRRVLPRATAQPSAAQRPLEQLRSDTLGPLQRQNIGNDFATRPVAQPSQAPSNQARVRRRAPLLVLPQMSPAPSAVGPQQSSQGSFGRNRMVPVARPSPARPTRTQTVAMQPYQLPPGSQPLQRPLGQTGVRRLSSPAAPTQDSIAQPVPTRGLMQVRGLSGVPLPQRQGAQRTESFLPPLPPLGARPDFAAESAERGGCPLEGLLDVRDLLWAISRHDDAEVRNIASRGRVNVNRWIDTGAATLGTGEMDSGYISTVVQPPTGRGSDRGDAYPRTIAMYQLPQVTARRDPYHTLLGVAVASGSPRVVAALIDAGAQPWPTREALLNSALSRIPQTHYDDIEGTQRRVDMLGVADVLLRRFGRSPRLDPLDDNPLTVARTAAVYGAMLDADPLHYLDNIMPAVLARLVAAGYSPDERASAVSRAPPSVEDAIMLTYRVEHSFGRGGTPVEGLPGGPTGAQRRAALSRLTERQAAEAWLNDALGIVASTRRTRLPEELTPLAYPLAEALKAVVALYGAPSSDDQYSLSTLYRAQRQTNSDEQAYGGDSQSEPSLFESLPAEVIDMIAASRGMRSRDLAALYGTSRALAAGVKYPLDVRRAAYEAYREPGAPCGDYVDCAAALLTAIARDDVEGVSRAIGARVVGLNALIDPRIVRQFGRPTTVVAVVPPAGSHRWIPDTIMRLFSGEHVRKSAADGHLRGSPYATPLALAATLKAPAVVDELAALGARPWPSIESLLERAMIEPFPSRVVAVTSRDPSASTEHESTYGAGRHALATSSQAQAYGASDTADVAARYLGKSDPHAEVMTRAPTAEEVVRSLLAHYPRSPRLDPGDSNPLTALRLRAEEAMESADDNPIDRAVVRSTLEPLIDVILSAGYSPDERGLTCASGATTERVLAAQWAAAGSTEAQRLLGEIFGNAYRGILPPLVSPSW